MSHQALNPVRRTLFTLALAAAPAALYAQAPAAATPAKASQLGTVKTVSGTTVTITTAAGAPITVNIQPDAPVLQLPPGSTDLKTATPSSADSIATGDRILATGKPGDTPDTVLATRIILMKSGALAARSQAEQADWGKRGVGGIVKSVDGSTLAISSGARTVSIQTNDATVFRRYADDSIKFEDAKSGKLADIHSGDQLTVRGVHSADNCHHHRRRSRYRHLLQPFRFPLLHRRRQRHGHPQGPRHQEVRHRQAHGQLRHPAASCGSRRHARARRQPLRYPCGRCRASTPSAPGGYSGGGGAGGGQRPGGGRNPGAMLSRMLASLPKSSITDLKAGDVVMIVASQESGAVPYTAITLLSGVAPLLTATPAGAQPITLSPWNISAPEGGGGAGGGPGGL